MKNLALFFSLFLVGLIGFSSCTNEELATDKETVSELEARQVVSNTLFLAALRRGWPVCVAARGTCDWRDGGCDIAWPGDVNDGLEFIEEAEDADVLMDIETYEGQQSLGLESKDFLLIF